MNSPTGVALWLMPSGLYTYAQGTSLNVYFDNSQYWPNAIRYRTYLVDQTRGAYATIWAYNNSINASIRDLAEVFSVQISNGQRVSVLAANSVSVTNNLTSTSTVNALSAAQGNILDTKIGGDLSTLTTTDKTSLIAAINELTTRVAALES